MAYIPTVYSNGTPPNLSAANLNKSEDQLKVVSDKIDGIESGADVTDEANVTAVANATTEVTAAPDHWWVLVGGALKRMTHAGFLSVIWAALGGLIAGGTDKPTPVDADTLPCADSAASNATKKLTWANVKAAIWAAWGALINSGTAKSTPIDADAFAMMDSAASNATKKLTWAGLVSTFPTATTSVAGKVQLAANLGTTAGTAVQASDTRLISALTTWTPVPMFGGVADDGTYTITSNKYVLSGKKVSGNATIIWTAKGTKTGAFTISGVPYTNQSVYASSPCGCLSFNGGFTGITLGDYYYLAFYNGITFFNIYKLFTSYVNGLTDTNFTNTSVLCIHFEYLIP